MSKTWCKRLMRAVSPLEHGVRSLSISGYKPPGETDFRPSRTAAVLVPLLNLPIPELVLTRRADHLEQHAGQVSFPGGAADVRPQRGSPGPRLPGSPPSSPRG